MADVLTAIGMDISGWHLPV